MSKGTVCLTFDYDAVSLWIIRGLTTPGPASRGELSAFAVPRLLHLLDSKGVLSTWFIPGHTVETYPSVCRDVVAAGHEIALHGYVHELVSSLSPDDERRVFERSHELLSRLTGKNPEGNRDAELGLQRLDGPDPARPRTEVRQQPHVDGPLALPLSAWRRRHARRTNAIRSADRTC